MGQLTIPGIFEHTPPSAKQPPPAVDLAALENYALLYTATDTGTNSGIRFMMTLEDAQKWCESPVSCGRRYDTQWAYFYTSVARFLGRDSRYGVWLDELDLRGMVDNGEWDERIAAAGCAKISLYDIPRILRPLGVNVLTDSVLFANEDGAVLA